VRLKSSDPVKLPLLLRKRARAHLKVGSESRFVWSLYAAPQKVPFVTAKTRRAWNRRDQDVKTPLSLDAAKKAAR
jgi:hypothetical protein